MTHIESKLRKAGLGIEIDKGSIRINNTQEIEVYVTDQDGDCDPDATEELKDRLIELLGWGGFKCAYGGWVLQKDYAGMFPALLDQLGVGAYESEERPLNLAEAEEISPEDLEAAAELYDRLVGKA